MSDEPLRIERRNDGVVLLTLALPERRNAMTGELTSAFGAAIDALRPDRSVRCVVVTGEGSAFCAGGDLSWIAESPDLSVDKIRDRMLPFYRVWLSIRELEVPSIAAVNGPAVGAGLCLALACGPRRPAVGAVHAAGHACRDGRDLPAARGRGPRRSARAAVHRTRRRRGRGAAPRSRQRRVRRRRPARRDARCGEQDRRRRPGRYASDEGRTAGRRTRDDRGRAAIRRARAAGDLRNRGPPRRPRGVKGEASGTVQGRLTGPGNC